MAPSCGVESQRVRSHSVRADPPGAGRPNGEVVPCWAANKLFSTNDASFFHFAHIHMWTSLPLLITPLLMSQWEHYPHVDITPEHPPASQRIENAIYFSQKFIKSQYNMLSKLNPPDYNITPVDTTPALRHTTHIQPT